MQVKLILYKNGKKVRYQAKDKTRRILSKASLAKFEKAYLYVSYGKKMCNLGCVCEFYNDGYYTSNEELSFAIKQFCLES